jgi:hypothetical protein
MDLSSFEFDFLYTTVVRGKHKVEILSQIEHPHNNFCAFRKFNYIHHSALLPHIDSCIARMNNASA